MSNAHVERRLTAILAADVAGYSRLMGLDEEEHFRSSGPTGGPDRPEDRREPRSDR